MSLTTELDSPVSSVGTFGPQEPSPPREMPRLIESPKENLDDSPAENSDRFSDDFEYCRSSAVTRPVGASAFSAAAAVPSPLPQTHYIPPPHTESYLVQMPFQLPFRPHPSLSLPAPPVSSPLWQPPAFRPPVAIQPPSQLAQTQPPPPYTNSYARTYGAVNQSFIPSPRPPVSHQRLLLAAPTPPAPPFGYALNQYCRTQLGQASTNPSGFWPVALPAPIPAYAQYPLYRVPSQHAFRQPPMWANSANSRQLPLQTPSLTPDSYSAIYSRERALQSERTTPQDTYMDIYMRSKRHLI